MTPRKYAIYERVFSVGETWTDPKETPDNTIRLREWIELFGQNLAAPARVLVPGAMTEALALAAAGYEVHALQLGDESIAWLNERRARLARPELLVIHQMDIHDLSFPKDFFDGYFSVQVNEHLMPWFVHVGEVRHCMRPGGVVFVDACGTINPAMNTVNHVNLVPEKVVREQWEFWGFAVAWRGPLVGQLGETGGDGRPQFIFTKQADDDPEWKHRNGLGEIMRARATIGRECDVCGGCDK